jgi:two-component system, NarL family, invasion response regulator UvrY
MRNILLADDHAVVRRGIRDILLEAFEDIEIREATDASMVLDFFGERHWALVLLDIHMPGPNILDLLARIRERDPAVPILILTASLEGEYIDATMKAGANGFIHKDRRQQELLLAVTEVMAGRQYVQRGIALEVAQSLYAKLPKGTHKHLSIREMEVIRHLALGRANKEIAFDLGVSGKTVATYLARIKLKTGLSGRVEIARFALSAGLVY